MSPSGATPNPDDAATGRLLAWSAYLFMAAEGYLIYAVGFISPYLQSDLAVPPWMAALPTSAMAVGIIGGGFVARWFVARVGPRAASRLSAALMAASAVLLAIPVTILPILAGALLFGVSAAGMMVHVNSALGRRSGGTLLVRANMWSVVGGTVGPLVLSAAARSVGWPLGALVPVPFLLALAFVLPASPARDVVVRGGEREPALPRPYWLTWAFLVLCIGAEFSFVTWGSQVATARSGIETADATALASLYVVGMVLGRLALSSGIGAGPRSRPILRACTGLAVVGSAVLWVAPTPALAGLGLFLGGLGISGIYPLGATLALAHAPAAPIRASARLTAASGGAILAAPLVLGLAAGAIGVVGAWMLVFGFLGTAFLILIQVPRPAPTGPSPGEAEAVATAA